MTHSNGSWYPTMNIGIIVLVVLGALYATVRERSS